MQNKVLYGDCLTQLRTLPKEIVQTCVTSPPYYGLRDYGTRRWFDEDPQCVHDTLIEHGAHHPGQVEQTKWKNAEAAGKGGTATTSACSKCGGWYGQLGLEPTPTGYVRNMVEVFREVKRVLRDDGTLWLNVGDSYADKNLLGIPWMLAFALRADGWILRSEVIWHKPNVMPESVEDRPTRAHEHVFLLSKSPNYFYDTDAIREGARNKRSIWAINTQPYAGAHFAVMPPELASTCIKAGSKMGDLVFDPFTGSGTTLAEALVMGRDYLGVELNEDYKPLIDERLDRAVEDAGQREIYRMMTDIEDEPAAAVGRSSLREG